MSLILFIYAFILSLSFAETTNFVNKEKYFVNSCFNVSSSVTLSQEGRTMTIKGTQTTSEMCDCNHNELKQYRDTVEIVIFDETVSSIGVKCFAQFKQLKEITFSDTVKSIKQFAFYNTKITNLTLPKKLIEIQSNAFSECKELKEVSFKKVEEGEMKEELIIGKHAFKNCKMLNKIEIIDRLKQFDPKIVDGCRNIQEVVVDQTNSRYQVVNNALISNDKKELIYYPTGLKQTYFVIPENVETIKEGSFSSSLPFEEIIISNSVKKIEKKTFYGLNKLKKIYLSQSIQTVGEFTFAFCSKLEEVVIASDNITLEKSSFLSCENLKKVTILSNNVTVQDNVFDKCDKLVIEAPSNLDLNGLPSDKIQPKNLTKGKCGETCSYIYNEDASGNNKLLIDGFGELSGFDDTISQKSEKVKTIQINKKIEIIGNEVFKNFTNVETLYIPSTVSTILSTEINSFQKLKNVYYEGIQPISNCSNQLFPESLEAVEVPWEYQEDKVCGKEVVSRGTCGDHCEWKYNHNQKSLTITGSKMDDFHSIYSIPWHSRLSEIKTIIIDGPENISKRAFIQTESLESILIKTNLTSVHAKAFEKSEIKVLNIREQKILFVIIQHYQQK